MHAEEWTATHLVFRPHTQSYHCLDHLHPLVPDLVDNARNVHHFLPAQLLQYMVYGDESPSPAHSSTATEVEQTLHKQL